MLDGAFRGPVDRAVRPIGALLRRTRITPDQLTLGGLVVAALAALAIGAGMMITGLILVIAAALPDLFDGALAKASGTSSQRGAFFDSTMDRITDALLFGGIAWYLVGQDSPRLSLLPFAVSAVASLISYQRAKAESLGIEAKGGLMERAERIVALCLGLLLEGVGLDGALVVILWVMLALIIITAIQRFVKVWTSAEVSDAAQRRIEDRRERRVERRSGRGVGTHERVTVSRRRGGTR